MVLIYDYLFTEWYVAKRQQCNTWIETKRNCNRLLSKQTEILSEMTKAERRNEIGGIELYLN